jgi:hypothetical protein
MRKFLCLAAAGALVSLPITTAAVPLQEQADAGDQSSEQSGEKEQAKADKKKKICKRIKSMGSRFSEKVCMTKDQWEAQREGAQDAARDKR